MIRRKGSAGNGKPDAHCEDIEENEIVPVQQQDLGKGKHDEINSCGRLPRARDDERNLKVRREVLQFSRAAKVRS